MTLILSVLTDDYVVQASDRRLTNVRTRAVVEEDANKAIVFCGHLAVGYTGLSRIRGVATDLWIAEVLRGCSSTKEAITALCRQATSDLAVVPAADRRQAFVLAGWSRLHDHADLQPCAFIVSNFFKATSEGEWLDTPIDEFTFAARLPPRAETPIVIAVPRAPKPPLVRVLRAVKDVVARGLGPTAIGRVLEDGIRQVAATVPAVGRDVMVCSIPRYAVATADASWSATPAGEPLSRTQVGSYYSTANRDVVIGGPNFVCGGIVTGRIRATTGPAPALTPEYIAQLARDLGVANARRR
jgi:hypothetical protein